jgi:uncharacterized MAPEG superfamily protein
MLTIHPPTSLSVLLPLSPKCQAKLPSEELNALAGAYLASRIAYTFLYLFVTSDALANLRSVSYLVGIGINSTLFVKAAIALK